MNDDQLRAAIEGLRIIPPELGYNTLREAQHCDSYNLAIKDVLALLASQATTREPDPTRMLADDNNRMRKAGNALAAAALRVTDEYDGVHRLRLAVADWSKAVADEGGRGEAPQGATVPEPLSFVWPALNDQGEPVEDMCIVRLERLNRINEFLESHPQGATETAQTATASPSVTSLFMSEWEQSMREFLMLVRRWGPSGSTRTMVHDDKGAWVRFEQIEMLCGGPYPPIKAEGSPQPAEPRPHIPYAGRAQPRITLDEVIERNMGDPEFRDEWQKIAAEGGDTLTPEPETAQIVAMLDHSRNPSSPLPHTEALAIADAMEAQAARIAALQAQVQAANLTLTNAAIRATGGTVRRALVGEEAP